MSVELERQVHEGEIVAETDREDFPYTLDSYDDHENAMVAERQKEDARG